MSLTLFLFFFSRRLRARVFAERTRIRKLAETKTCGKTLSSLKSENTKLKKRVARFEATEIKLQAQIKKLMAEKRTAGR
jgi:predicted RNase H-like nuclease (RuvC/YqgF family)